MVTVSSPATNLATVPAATLPKSAPAPRLTSVDLLRGLVMIIMALDHTRDFFTNIRFQPEDLSHTYGALFFTRVITHFCAPVFSLLAGTGAFLATSRGKSVAEISRFFWTRGLWLVFLEMTVEGFAWTFHIPFGFAAVIWALGWAMVAMALIVRLPMRWIGAFGIAMIAGHNLLDGISPDSLGTFSGLWTILHSQGMVWIKQPTIGLFIMYPLVPWIGVMACGYAMGPILLRSDRKKVLFRIGLALTAAFFVLRGFNLYGNGTAGYPFSIGPWHVQSTISLTLISFFNTLKYPPSLDYLLMTLGPALMVLSWLESVDAEKAWARVVLVFGRVPLFYFLGHLYLIHVMAIAAALAFHQPAAWLWHGAMFEQAVPDGYGYGLPFVYLMWILVVVILYLPCRWYMNFKREHRDWSFLSYL
jgi:uncharacterized membrane protein